MSEDDNSHRQQFEEYGEERVRELAEQGRFGEQKATYARSWLRKIDDARARTVAHAADEAASAAASAMERQAVAAERAANAAERAARAAERANTRATIAAAIAMVSVIAMIVGIYITHRDASPGAPDQRRIISHDPAAQAAPKAH